MHPTPPRHQLFPYTTLFRSKPALEGLAGNLEKAYPVEQKDQTFMVRSVPHNTVSNNPAADSGLKAIAPLLLGMAVVVLLVDRKSTRLNSSHITISYAVFCLK